MKFEGGCQCGAVRYVVSAKPYQSMICHCETCRSVSGGLVVGWVAVDPAAFTITKGKPKPYSSSPGVARTFCGDCGAQLTYAREDDDSYIDITTTTFDDPDAFPPSHHSWLSDDIAWVKFGDDLPKYQKSRGDG